MSAEARALLEAARDFFDAPRDVQRDVLEMRPDLRRRMQGVLNTFTDRPEWPKPVPAVDASAVDLLEAAIASDPDGYGPGESSRLWAAAIAATPGGARLLAGYHQPAPEPVSVEAGQDIIHAINRAWWHGFDHGRRNPGPPPARWERVPPLREGDGR